MLSHQTIKLGLQLIVGSPVSDMAPAYGASISIFELDTEDRCANKNSTVNKYFDRKMYKISHGSVNQPFSGQGSVWITWTIVLGKKKKDYRL